jgi:hypothetical protein
LYPHKKLEASAEIGIQHHKGKIAKETVPVYIAEDEYHQNAKAGDSQYLQVKLIVFFGDEEYNRRRKIEAFLNRKRPALRNTGKIEVVKKAPHKGDVHKEQANRTWEIPYYAGVSGKEVVYKCPSREQEIHGVDTCHAVFEVLLEPVGREFKAVKIPERNKKARKHKEYGYTDVELQEKTP